MDKGEWIKGVAHWVEGETAFISIAFTWRLPEARRIAEYYRSLGLRVRAGGPGTFTKPNYLADVAEVGGSYPDAVARHNPMATFASRGCPVGCWFCIVPKMEGKEFTLFPDFPVRPVLCDNNLSALSPEYQEHIVSRYRQTGVPLLDANSGFEPGTFDDEVFRRWSPVLKEPWRFGYDEKTEGRDVERVMQMLRDESPRRKQVYTMIGHEPFDVCMERIQRVIAWGGEPYAQPFMKLNALQKKPAIRHDWTAQKLQQVQRWTNRHLWRKTPSFANYNGSAKTPRPTMIGWSGTLFCGAGSVIYAAR
ncbi:MAG: hypothetical protein M3Y41_04105 [Pseudomonadota bacterium]|nr:hypothetical protein [Pseudomonadota bacterium]